MNKASIYEQKKKKKKKKKKKQRYTHIQCKIKW